jgi:hypothetical protein
MASKPEPAIQAIVWRMDQEPKVAEDLEFETHPNYQAALEDARKRALDGGSWGVFQLMAVYEQEVTSKQVWAPKGGSIQRD